MTAKFGNKLNEQMFKNLKTQKTQLDRSNINNESTMKIDQLQPSILINNTRHRINSHSITYNCSICERLRLICPTKNYITHQYCEKCRRTNVNIHQNVTLKDLNMNSRDFESTKGHQMKYRSNSISNNQNIRIQNSNDKHYQEVNKVRIGDKVFPLKIAPSTNEASMSSHQTIYKHHIQQNIKPIIKQPLVTEQIIFYPVIHNKLVYVNSSNPQKSQQKNKNIGRNRFMSESVKRSRIRLQDFQPLGDRILTPNQMKNLAKSIRRQITMNQYENQQQ